MDSRTLAASSTLMQEIAARHNDLSPWGTILGGGKGTGGHSSPALVWLQVDEQRVLAKEGQKTHRMT